MSFGGEAESSGVLATFKSFVSEDQLEEKRRLRQEEWEKVRKPEDPEEAPEPEYDGRCLYDKLQEQKLKKEEEIEAKHRLSNQVTGIDEGEAEFLDFVSQRRSELTKARDDENEAVLQEYRDSVVTRAEPSTKLEKKPAARPQASKSKSQLSLLAGAVKRKSTDPSTDADTKKRKADDDEKDDSTKTNSPVGLDPKLARIVAVLPGLGAYSNSSDSESSSSDSDIEQEQHKHRNSKQCSQQGHSH